MYNKNLHIQQIFSDLECSTFKLFNLVQLDLIIDGRQWRNVEKQLQKSSNIYLRIIEGNMIKKILIFIIVLSPIDMLAQYLECFTHPLCKIDAPIPIYSEPYVYIKDLYILGEAGYEVEALKRDNNFILISHLPNENEPIWVQIGDVGIVIQNYNKDSIPVYSQPDSLSMIQTYLLESHIALFDWNENFVLMQIKEHNMECTGWINRRYVCGSPYTTCN